MKKENKSNEVIIGNVNLSKSISPEMKIMGEIQSRIENLDQKYEKRFDIFEKKLDEIKIILQDISSKLNDVNSHITGGDEPEKEPNITRHEYLENKYRKTIASI